MLRAINGRYGRLTDILIGALFCLRMWNRASLCIKETAGNAGGFLYTQSCTQTENVCVQQSI